MKKELYVISIIFFAKFLQESHQNLMWKVVTIFNLNPPLKLFFYLPILANNNLLLKIYCENIVVVFLNCHFLILNTTCLNKKKKKKKPTQLHKKNNNKTKGQRLPHIFIRTQFITQLSTSHILHSYHLSHSHIQFTLEKREVRERRI